MRSLCVLSGISLLLVLPASATAVPFAYVTDYYEGVKVVDTDGHRVVATVPVGNTPLDIAVDRSGRRVYVANVSSDTVSVIDAGTNAVIATIRVGSSPCAVALNPTRNVLYVEPLAKPS